MARRWTIAGAIGSWTLCAASAASCEEASALRLPEPPDAPLFDLLAAQPPPFALTEAFTPDLIRRGLFAHGLALEASASLSAITRERFGAGDAWGVSFSSHLTSAQDERGTGSVGNGAEVRIGQRLREGIGVLDAGSKPGWFLFAGGGGQAITYSPGSQAAESPGGAVRLQDRVRVGSVQAGVGVQHHGMEASLGYVRKDINFGDALPRQQHFAGVSFTFRR